METDNYIYLGDSYIEFQCDEKEVAQYKDDILNGKIKIVISNKFPKNPVKLTKRKLKKHLKYTYYTISTLWIII